MRATNASVWLWLMMNFTQCNSAVGIEQGKVLKTQKEEPLLRFH